MEARESGPDSAASAQLEAIAEITRLLDGAAVPFWLAGGWAVDFHLGRISRAHSDIDIVVERARRAQLTTILERAGYEQHPTDIPQGLAVFDRAGCRIEVTFITEVDGTVVTPGYEHWPWDEGSFPDVPVEFAGITLWAMSIAGLLAVKEQWQHRLGEPPRPHDLADVEALRRQAE